MIALSFHRIPPIGTDLTTLTILTIGRCGRKFFTVPYQQYTHSVCTYSHSQVTSASRTDLYSSTGISTFVAAVPFVIRQFHVTREVALLPVTLYTVGFILGPLICSPFSELYGRRMIYWTNFPMLVIFNAIAAASDNFAVLVIFRFLAGFGGSGVLAVGAGIYPLPSLKKSSTYAFLGTISDLWDPKDAGRVGLSYILAPFLGPTLGPLIGAFVIAEYHNDWKYAIWVDIIILAPVGLAIVLMQETSKSRILYLRAKRRGSRLHEDSKSVVLKKLGKTMLKPLHMCIFEVCF